MQEGSHSLLKETSKKQVISLGIISELYLIFPEQEEIIFFLKSLAHIINYRGNESGLKVMQSG